MKCAAAQWLEELDASGRRRQADTVALLRADPKAVEKPPVIALF